MAILTVGPGGFATIQLAVNASGDGDTIIVSAGIYVEQVVVTARNDLTIAAADGAQVTIQAPADLVETARSSSDREIHAVFTATGSTAGPASAGRLRYENISSGGPIWLVQGDTDGDGQSNFEVVLVINVPDPITSGDFIL